MNMLNSAKEELKIGNLLISKTSRYTNCKIQNVFFDHNGLEKFLLNDVFGDYHELYEDEIDYNFIICRD